tara:strand:+ start:898 stop:1464 length:567 start_codon:yes stop_codon:yes gene_type:complete
MRFDCIIVLAHEMSKSAELNEESSLRIDYACELFLLNRPIVLITPGWNYRKDCNQCIGEIMMQYAINYGIPSESIYPEINSRDTVGDAFFSKINHVEKNNFKNILVVTSDYHEPRTIEIFRFIYGEKYNIKVHGVKIFNKKDMVREEKKSLKSFKKTFYGVQSGNNNEILNRLKKHHPFYNGKIYPSL